MVVLSCPITDCGFKTDDVDLVGAATILSVYAHAHTIPHPNATPVTLLSGPKLVRPRILYNVEVWNAFLRRWDTGSGITDAAAPGQLLECIGECFGNVVLCAHPDFTSRNLKEALVVLKSIHSCYTSWDEPFSNFAAQV